MQIEIDISADIKRILNRNNVQCFSLATLDNSFKKVFAASHGLAMVLYRGKVFQRHVTLLDNQHLSVLDSDLSVYLRAGELLVVILPGLGQKRYVMQTIVEEIYASHFTLVLQDPRFNKRYQPSLPVNIQLWQTSPAILQGLIRKTLRLVREAEGIYLPMPESRQLEQQRSLMAEPADLETLVSQGKKAKVDAPSARASTSSTVNPASQPEAPAKPRLTDLLYEHDKEQIAAEFMAMHAKPSLPGKLLDVSRGGLCAGIKLAEADALVNQLLYVGFQLEAGSGKTPGNLDGDANALEIKAFAMVRGWSRMDNGCKLHFIFLSGLPDSTRAYFPR